MTDSESLEREARSGEVETVESGVGGRGSELNEKNGMGLRSQFLFCHPLTFECWTVPLYHV